MNLYQPASLFEAEPFDHAKLLALLLVARSASAEAGNRRGLFARMDELLAEFHGPKVVEPGSGSGRPLGMPNSVSSSERVSLSRIRLRNWKSFETADISLPSPSGERSMVVIGGPNGFGKSSILEAYLFGLFGRRAVSDLGVLISGAGTRGDQRKSYRAMLQRSLHRSSKAASGGTSSVTLDFETGSGPVQVERRWYFDDKGRLIEEDEELLVRVGEDRELLRAPAGLAPGEWQQGEVERLIMPVALAPFFVFDGEQIERRADRRLTDQVRSALTRLLGLEDIAGLATDLRDYARDRTKGHADVDEAVVEALRGEIERGAATLVKSEHELSIQDGELARLRDERDRFFVALSTGGGASHAELQHALETEHRLVAERRQLDRERAATICEEGPFILASADLLQKTAARIKADGDQADMLVLEGDEISMLWNRFVAIDPPMSAKVASQMRNRFDEALGTASGSPADMSHLGLDRTARKSIVDKLLSVAANGTVRLRLSAADILANDEQIERTRSGVADQERAADARAIAQSELGRISALIRAAEEARSGLASNVATLRVMLAPKRAELERRDKELQHAEPRLRSAALARLLAGSLEAHATEIADGEHARFAAAVTRRFREMAHKEQIVRIDISRDGAVLLIDANDRDVSDYPLSAGESQVFAMALVAAVGDLAGDRLPLIVDTPLGRLDTHHRQNVLAMLSRRAAQTIMLTQPEEISNAHLEALEPVLSLSAHLQHAVDTDTGVGVSRIVPSVSAAAA